MPAQQLIIIVFGSVLILLSIILLVLIVSYHSMVKKFRFSQKENTYLKNHVHERSMEELDEARKKAIALLEEAEKKAAEIVSTTKTYENQANASMTQTLKQAQIQQAAVMAKTTDTLVKEYDTTLEQTEQDNLKTLQSVSNLVQDTANKELTSLKDLFAKEVTVSEKALSETLSTAYDKANTDVDAYKKARLAKVDDQILQLIKTISEDVFGRAIPVEQHQEIVLQALEHAKKELAQ